MIKPENFLSRGIGFLVVKKLHSFQRIVLHLSLIDGVGPATIAACLNSIEKSLLLDFYTFTVNDFVHHCKLSPKKAETIVKGLSDISLLEKELELLQKHSIGLTTILDDDYPEFLAEIAVPPAVFYWYGQPLGDLSSSLAIVGSRAMNRYGKMAIEMVVPSLVDNGWTIISGGALGVDSYAHQVTLREKGRTIVVLGSGILSPYPFSNKKLFREVVENGGTIISVFPLKMAAKPGNFPARNRIISGLSRGCLVVQAAKKSGASITARYALEQGRDVFTVPGPIDDPLSAGCHSLIKQGAVLVQSVEDIYEEYGILVEKVQIKQENRPKRAKITEKEVKKARNLDLQSEKIISSCFMHKSLDEIAQETNIESDVLCNKLFDLQLEGLICQEMGLWKRL